MPVSAAIGGIASAAGSIGSAIIGSDASAKASRQQQIAQQQALYQQMTMFNEGKAALQPFYTQGSNALSSLIGAGNEGSGAISALKGLGTTASGALSTLMALTNPGTAASTLSTLPGFQFQSQWGNIAAQNALAAQGLGGSAGPVGRALSDYNQGLAGTYWQNAVNALQGVVNTGVGALQGAGGLSVNALSSASGIGGNAAAGLAGNATQSGQGQANTLGNIGNAQAAGTLGSANALSNGLSGVGGSVSNSLLLSQLLGRNNGGGGGGLYTPAQIASIGNMDASAATDAQAQAYGAAMGFV